MNAIGKKEVRLTVAWFEFGFNPACHWHWFVRKRWFESWMCWKACTHSMCVSGRRSYAVRAVYVHRMLVLSKESQWKIFIKLATVRDWNDNSHIFSFTEDNWDALDMIHVEANYTLR